MAATQARYFSAAAGYETIQQDKFYTPVRPVSGQTVVFDAETKERRFVPWEVKEATIKNSLGLLGVYMFDVITPLGPAYGLSQAFFCFNYCRTVWGFMSNAVTKMELMADGKRVQLTFGRASGKTIVVDIKDIQKGAHEKALVETFEESTMYPIVVGKNTYYLNGPGQEAIKNGEVFRAIVNG